MNRTRFPSFDLLRRPVRVASRVSSPEPGSLSDEFSGVKGDVRKWYRSAVDQSLQPYRLFVPTAYEGHAIPDAQIRTDNFGTASRITSTFAQGDDDAQR